MTSISHRDISSRDELVLRRLLGAMEDLRDGNFRRRLLTVDAASSASS